MIFITVGSRSFQFNRLLEAIDKAVSRGEIKDNIYAQIGSSDYKVKNFKCIDFLNHDEFNKCLDDCDIVVTHGGTGVIVNAVKRGKRVVAVPRLARYGEVVDDHQIQLVKEFEKVGMVTACYDCDHIADAIQKAVKKEAVPYVSNTQNIIDSIEDMIKENFAQKADHDSSENKKIRILMCSSARSEKGGMNSVIEQLMTHEWDEDLEFSYLATHISGNSVKKILFFAKAYKKLHSLIKKNAFDIIHIHMSYKGSFHRKYMVAKLCKKNGKKVIIHLHGSEFKDFYNNGKEKLKKKIREFFTEADCSIVLGEAWKQFIKSIAPNSNIVVINNAIKIPNISVKKENDIPVFLFLGALIKRKGVIDFLTAANQLIKSGVSDFKIFIAGTGEEEEKLAEYTIKNGLTDIVQFLGWINNEQKTELLKQSDILVLPSYNEGLPIAILEALSYGLPVISTNVGSISEAVIDGTNGFLYTPGDVDKLAMNMKQIVEAPNLWNKFSSESRNIAEQKFSDVTFFEKIENKNFKLAK